MKTLKVELKQLRDSGRWDLDFHSPAIGINEFASDIVCRLDRCADIIRIKRDPTLHPAERFLYVDISSIDVTTGEITSPQELIGEEAPSRARKEIQAFDIIISTCRPTRGAIAVVSEELHGEICSTGFSVIRAKPHINPFYLHFALRHESTLEQFRKFSTGASYPAILDSDVAKTRIPCPDSDTQNEIAKMLLSGRRRRGVTIEKANRVWQQTVTGIVGWLRGGPSATYTEESQHIPLIYSIEQIRRIKQELSKG